jgi:hypothetical protein
MKGMYIQLFHGRKEDEKLKDWGVDGPIFGPVTWCHLTYLTTLTFGFKEGYGECECELQLTSELVHYDGIYYGDLELTVFTDEEKRQPWFKERLCKWEYEKAFEKKASTKKKEDA